MSEPRALTLHQPWASLIALGVKTIETRSWSTPYRGRLLIHAGAKPPAAGAVGGWFCDPRYRVDGQWGPVEPRIWRDTTGEGDLFASHESRPLPLGVRSSRPAPWPTSYRSPTCPTTPTSRPSTSTTGR